MTLPKFILGLAIVIAIVFLWSYFDAASWGTILLRVVICAVILQIGYFLAVVAMVTRAPRPAATPTSSKSPAEAAPVPQADELTPKGSPQ
ncbi:exopolysaccharide production repressor protein [Aminobacter sp. HY435]|uniref:exopolysaccharide production repressor protein n=1 Tax=Aminobacter sp. HY435 TaxID=2970917 RepID=UPI0022B96D8E|nr:exopolysaccharide production repressor protein [Aminobacter sp. HY435]